MADFVSGEGHTILLAFWTTVKVSALSAAGSSADEYQPLA